MKRILVIGDLHCGSLCGLTPPDYMVGKGRSQFYHDLQAEMWDRYLQTIDIFGEVDALVVNGDVIDGKGRRSGGTEQITSDMLEQSDMAIDALSRIKCGKSYFTYGTPYHTAGESGEDIDRLVANAFKAPIEDELNLDVDGLVFNIRHKVGASGSPYNRAMQVGKHRMWDALKSLREHDEPADVYVRSHVHYFSYCGESNWTAFTLPALQASNTKYGARQCAGLTDWGMVLFNVDGGRLCGWDCRLYELMSGRKRTVKA